MFLFMLYHLKWLPIVDSNHASRINSPPPSPRLLMGNVSTYSKFGGPYRGRTGDYALQGHCVPNYTNSPNYLASRQGVEPRPSVLETDMLP